MFKIRLLFSILFCYFQLDLTYSQVVCTDQSWCASFARFCTDARYQEGMRSNCPNVCGSCPIGGTSDVRCSTNNGECEHLCNIHNNAIQCSCHPGYELISNGKNCTDIDECASQNRVCPEPSRPFCVNLKGSFQCSNQSCRAVNGQSNRYQSGTCCQHEIGSTCGGDSVPDERIVGGKSSFLGGWPWMVYILIDGSTLCGGTLIDEYWVVTAAHCFKTATSSTTVKMYFGRLNPYATREQEPHVQIRDAVQLILHEEWDKNRFPYNDIALLRVGTAVRFNQFTNKVCLPNGESPSPGTRCWVTGFGTTAYRGPAAKILREVSLPIVDLNTCARSYTSTSYPIDQQKMLCAGYAQGGRDACQGDSGGPLVCQRCDSCSWYLAGVVSYGKGCATPTYYGVYTNVEKYEQWISSKTDIPVHKNRTCTPGVAAGWTLWLSWDQCSTTCAAGSRSRRRSCISGTAGGPGCRGSSVQTESCNTQPCPAWGVWGEWEPCTVRCGVGEKVKSRQCVNGNIGDVGCESSGATITESCNTSPCATWSVWAGWSDCTNRCGGGTRFSTRTCSVVGSPNPCEGAATKTEECNTIQCPTWRAWVWSSCTTTCGGGMQSGVRTCNQYGGNVDCEGPQTRTKPCETVPCPRWGEYGTWSDCSASCSGGTQTRTRPCVDGVIGNIGCTSGDETEQQTCNTEVCGTWQQWSSWSQCSKSCNGGTKQSTRQCNGGVVGQGGCPGTSTRTEDCPSRPCPVWSEWSDFSECSKSCERGLRTRNRTCLNGNVGDIGCHVGQPSMNRICNTHACPRFTSFGSWSDCSKTCGNGTSERVRTCRNGVVGDLGCRGHLTQTKACNTQDCPYFSIYSSWSACNATCGGGYHSRSRTCVNGIVGDIGCVGDTVDHKPCNAALCPIWTDWSEWSSCSATCGPSTKQSIRICLNANDEHTCVGDETKNETCQTTDCEGDYSTWGAWSECSVTCGSGTKNRLRTCTGGSCLDRLSETQNCQVVECVGEWTQWTAFSPCSKSCGTDAFKVKTRQCLGGGTCSGASMINTTCGVECVSQWTEWGAWTNCDKSCSGGIKTRTRTCIGGEIGSSGCPTSGASARGVCNETPCPDCVDAPQGNCASFLLTYPSFCYLFRNYAFGSCAASCNFCHEQWGTWTACSATCGVGSRSRSRTCLNLSGIGCHGSPSQTGSCNTDSCSGFSQWSQWSQCTVSCGGGTQTRNRECPSGVQCPPDEFGVEVAEEQPCGVISCPGRWSAWGSWQDCPVTCGDGQRRKERQCIGGVAGGPGCEINNGVLGFTLGPCRNSPCPGVWGQFVESGTCSASCGNGTITMTRECIGGVIGGAGCEGDSTMMSPCYLGECVTSWQAWGGWGECNVTCGGGIKSRTRLCDNGSPGDVGCDGSAVDVMVCNQLVCSQGPCSGLVNTLRPLTTTSNCYSKISWCSTFVQYMGGACARACCENRNGLQITLTVCQDTPTYSDYCQGQQQYCQQSSLATIASPEYVSFVYLNCGKSCGFCRTG